MDNFEQIGKDYLAKFEQVKKDNPDYENYSICKLWSIMDLTDDELWYLSYLDILNEEQNMVWEGFPESSPEEKIALASEKFLQNKAAIDKLTTSTT